MRYTIELPEKIQAIVDSVAKDQEITKAEFMRRAILTYAVLHKETSAGKAITLTKEGEASIELVMTI